MAKSMSVVVPPKAAAMVPVSKSSALVVPPKGMSRCVCTSMPPGINSNPVASMMRPAFSTGSCVAMAPTRSPVIPTSARQVSVAVTTVALRITVSKRMGFLSGRLYDGRFQNGKEVGTPRRFSYPSIWLGTSEWQTKGLQHTELGRIYGTLEQEEREGYTHPGQFVSLSKQESYKT